MLLKFVILKNRFLFRNIISDAVSGFLFVIIQISFFTNFVIDRLDYKTQTAIIYFVCGFILSACCASRITEEIPLLYLRNTLSKKLLFVRNYFWYILKYNVINKLFLFSLFSILFVIIALPFGIFSIEIVIHLPLFVLSVLLSFFIDVALRIIFGLAIMKNHNFIILTKTYNQIDRILSGAIVPLSFLPNVIQTIFFCLPFYFLIFFPLEVLIDGVTMVTIGNKSINGLLVQSILAISITIIARIFFSLRIKKLQREGSL
ncbi:MAG: hypothetical protein P1P64_00400 [Treponemataceae bacterium]